MGATLIPSCSPLLGAALSPSRDLYTAWGRGSTRLSTQLPVALQGFKQGPFLPPPPPASDELQNARPLVSQAVQLQLLKRGGDSQTTRGFYS